MEPPVTAFDTDKVLTLRGILRVNCPACGHANRVERKRFTADEKVNLICHDCEAVLAVYGREFRDRLV